MIDKLRAAVEKTVYQFQEHPLGFLSEREIQAWLFVELRKATSDLRHQYPGGGANLPFGFIDPFSIHPVTMEYHLYRGQGDRFDVAVLSEQQDSKSDIWRQPCRVAVEIKLWQPGYKCDLSDVAKLQNYQKYLKNNFTENYPFTGIAMLFVHPHINPGDMEYAPEQTSGDEYPEDGIALHFVTKTSHWWKQQA